MRIARLETADGPRYVIRAGEGWAVVEDCFADPPILTGVTVSDADARLQAPCETRVLVGIAHNKTNTRTVNIEGELAVVIGRDTKGSRWRPPSTTYRATRWSTT
jgi:hypothetical protein